MEVLEDQGKVFEYGEFENLKDQGKVNVFGGCVKDLGIGIERYEKVKVKETLVNTSPRRSKCPASSL